MPTVIDSLIIEIGLDPSKFTKGQKEAIKSFNEARDAAVRTAESIENSSKKSAEFLGKLNSGLLALGGLLVGSGLVGGAIKFVTSLEKQDAASGRLAYSLETNVATLDKWRNAAYLAGGTSEGTTTFIQGLTSEFQKFAIHGQSTLIPYFQGLGVHIADLTTGKMRPFADIMRDVSNAVAKRGPAEGAEWLRSIGADQGSINLLIKGGDELEKYLKLAGQFSTLTSANVENATKFDLALRSVQLALTGAGRALVEFLAPKPEWLNQLSAELRYLTKSESGLDFLKRFGKVYTGGAPTENQGSTGGAFKSNEEKEAFIRNEALKRNINPDIAVAVWEREGKSGYTGDQGTSFGAFQLHYGGRVSGGNSVSGLGDVFTKKTGLDARDPATERQQIQFALDEASKSGWGAWHGWKGSTWAGINRGGGGGSNTDIKIGNINIQTQATDASGIAATIKPAIERSSTAYQGQGGVQ